MFRQLLQWRILMAVIAILIVSGTIFYSTYLAKKIEKEEKQKVEEWVEAGYFINSSSTVDTRLASLIIFHTDIPIIETNERDSITNWVNLDTIRLAKGWSAGDSKRILNNNKYLKGRLESFKSSNPPIEWIHPMDSTIRNRYYYGATPLLNEVRYYPLIQLFIVGLFIVITLFSLRSSYRSTQNQVWAGMAKETAHQLGTPVSSLEGWVEILKETHGGENFVSEIEKDVNRLRLVSDRFGKIGSTPKLEETNVVQQVENMITYVSKRSPGSVQFILNTNDKVHIPARLSPPLFDWVIENLLKNALDAMEGKGLLKINISEQQENVIIDITDTGKGISKQNLNKVFKPGFTTKKRGWGLGLSLSRRIISEYHKGSLFVKHSEPGKGTTFRIILKK